MKKILAIGVIVLLLLACSIGLVTAEEQSEKYAVINAPLSPIKGEDVYSIPLGSLIYHSADGITTVYAPDGKIILKARDSEAAIISIPGVPATKVHAVPSGTFCTMEPIKFYTEDRGWIMDRNATKGYGPDGTLLLAVTGEKSIAGRKVDRQSGKVYIEVTAENQSEEYVVINAPLSPMKGEYVYYIPPGSVIYSADGITTVYTPDGKIILKAKDSDAAKVPMYGGVGAVPATKVHAVPSGTFGGAREPIKFYTEDRGWIVGNATKTYAPDGTVLLTRIHGKSTIGEKTEGVRSSGSGHTGYLEFANDTVSTLQEFTAYWDCPSSPPRGTRADVGLFNAIQDYTGWTKVVQPVLEWNSTFQKWKGFPMWGPDADGDYWHTEPKIPVDVSDRLKGVLEWDDANSYWHIWFYNLDTSRSSNLTTDESVVDNTDLEILTALEAGTGFYVYDYTDLPGDTTFYDMSFIDPQGSPVDIEWQGWIRQDVQEDIPELDIIIYSDSKVKLVTRGTSLDTIPLDVILVTDLSGSMGGALSDAKTAAKTFVDQLSGQDKVGLVSFTSTATLDRHLTSDFDDVKNVIDGYSASGGTNMGDGITEAINELNTNGRAEALHTIIVLSDGYTIGVDEILNTIVPQAVSAGITIYTFGYDGANEGFLTQVATATGGEYHFEPDSAALTAIYTQLSQSMPPEEEDEGSVGQDETAEEFHWLDVVIEVLKIILHWPGSDLDLTIIDPNGTVMEPGMPGVFYSGNDTYPEYYEIHNPQPGNWTIQIYGKNVTGEYENYTVTVFHPGALMQVEPTKWDIDFSTEEHSTVINVSEIGGMSNLINVTFAASDLVEEDTGAAAARKAEMEARAEAERKMGLEKQVEGQEGGKGTNSTQAMSLLSLPQEWIRLLIEKLNYFSPETASSKPLKSQKLNGNTIPASSFSFSPNNFNVTAGGSQNVTATLTIPPGTPPGDYSGTIDVTSSNGNNATISVSVAVPPVPPPPTTCCFCDVETTYDCNYGKRGVVENGTVYVGGGRPIDLRNPYMEFNVPNGSIKWARVYWHIWGGNPSGEGWTNATFCDANGCWHDNQYIPPIDDPNYPNNCEKDEADGFYMGGCGTHWVYWTVTDKVTNGYNNITLDHSTWWDGRCFSIYLVVVLDEMPGYPRTYYWINQGYEYLERGYTSTTWFNGPIDTNVDHTLWHLAFGSGELYEIWFNDHFVEWYWKEAEAEFIPKEWIDPDQTQNMIWDNYDNPRFHPVMAILIGNDIYFKYPDLVVSELVLEFNETSCPDQTLTGYVVNHVYDVRAKICNIAGKSTGSSFDVTLYDNGVAKQTNRMAPLDKGKSRWTTFQWTPTTFGDHELRIMADNATEILESDETNNNKTQTETVLESTGLPDLIPDAMDFSPAWQCNKTEVTVTVLNDGTVDAGSFDVKVTMRKDSVPIWTDTQSTSVCAKAKRELIFSPDPELIKCSDYNVTVELDPTNAVGESNEDNNTDSKTFHAIEVLLKMTHHYGNWSDYNGQLSNYNTAKMFETTKVVTNYTTPWKLLTSEADVTSGPYAPPYVWGINRTVNKGTSTWYLYETGAETETCPLGEGIWWHCFINGIPAQEMPYGVMDIYYFEDGEVMRMDIFKHVNAGNITTHFLPRTIMDYPEPFLHGYDGEVWDTTIVYPSNDPSYAGLANAIQNNLLSEGVANVNIKTNATLTDTEKQNNNLILLGTPLENNIIELINAYHTEVGMSVYFDVSDPDNILMIDDWLNDCQPATFDCGGVVIACDNPFDNGDLPWTDTWRDTGPSIWIASGVH
ncbi:MAG TPA: hypothetical protein C5S37_07415 [Methanophagales archaeon]|nr:hypothetical protein [Methanophagales archaeon]